MTVDPDVAAIETSFVGVAHLLRDRQLEVPAYQRSYSWTEDQVSAYWHDLRAALVAEQPVYFLGTVVLTMGPGERSTVIDGQQRLATTSMLLAAIRDVFRDRNDSGSADQVAMQYVSTTSLITQRAEPRLLLNHVDRDTYQAVVVDSGALAPDAPDSGKRLAECFAYLKRELSKDIDSAGPYWRQRLINWIQMLDSRTRVIVVSVRDDADAFMIFETLNDRGLALTVADLVKNYLFGLCRDQIANVEEQWISALGNFDNPAASVEFTTFLRQWWNSQQGATRERDLYRRIRHTITTESAAVRAIGELATAAPLFSAMLNAEHEYWSEQGRDLSEPVRVLLELGLEQHRPLLLAAMSKFQASELEALMRGLISWSVRGLVVGGIGGGTTERYYAEAAVAVTTGRVNTAAQVMDLLEPIIPTDRDFFVQFSTRRVHKLGLLHYYLRAVAAGDSVPQTDERDFVVMPVLYKGEYEFFLHPDEDDPVDKRIGNYMLVPKSEAAELRRDKTARLAEAGKFPSDGQHFALHGVASRQEMLADLAVLVWPRQP